MRTFHSLRLQNVFLFKDQTFDLSHKGISVVLGQNGHGKSSFFANLPELFFGTPVLGVKRDRAKAGKVTVKLQVGDTKYTIKRVLSKGEKLHVYECKPGEKFVAKEFREVAEARAEALRILGMGEDEAYTRFYLDARKPHPLILGDTAARRKFFTNFFHLDDLSSMQKMVRGVLGEIGNARILLKELEGQVGALNVLPKEEILKLQESLEQLEGAKAKYGRLVERASRLRQLSEARNSNLYRTLHKRLNGDFTTFATEYEKVRRAIASTKVQLAAARKYTAYKERLAEWKEEQKELADYSSDKVNRKVERLQAYEAQLDATKQEIAQLKEAFTTAKERAKNNASLANDIQEDLHKAKRATSETCPTCGGPLSEKHQRHARRHLQELKEQLQQATERERKFGEQASRLALELEQHLTSYEALTERVSRYEKYRDIQTRLKNSSKPAPFEGFKYSEEGTEEKLDRLQERESLFRSCEHLHKSFQLASQLSEQDLRFAEKGTGYQEKLVSVTEKIARLQLQLEEQTRMRQQRHVLRKRAEELQEKAEQEEAYRLLEQAFSNKGIKALAIRSICERLETTVNKYAKVLFPADFVFRFDLDTQFNITVERNFGKKRLVSDVRKLSGAESKLFSVVLLVALITFVPPRRRTNLLILDEPTGALTAESSEAFCKFLPVLNKHIPHIVVITPRTEDVRNVEGARYFRVERNKDVATINQV